MKACCIYCWMSGKFLQGCFLSSAGILPLNFIFDQSIIIYTTLQVSSLRNATRDALAILHLLAVRNRVIMNYIASTLRYIISGMNII